MLEIYISLEIKMLLKCLDSQLLIPWKSGIRGRRKEKLSAVPSLILDSRF